MAEGAAPSKAQVAREVCAASAAFTACTHRRRSPRRPPFVDWYLVLAIGEATPEDAVRRRYRHLALQLHPDKNRHPKAEVAFKIVSEAHACLTDEARRRAFDAERCTTFCAACHDRFRSSSSPSSLATPRHRADRTATTTPAAASNVNSAKPARAKKHPAAAAEALREVQNRMRDECRVIDSCIKANDAAARRRQSFPLFDPHCFPDYPHVRPPFAGCETPELWRFEDQNLRSCGGGGGGRSGDSPVYQIRTAPELATRTKRPFG